MDYEKDMEIIPDALDVECTDQPSLVMKYARIAADADMVADLAKDKLDLVKAELDNTIRTKPEKFGLEKLTEAVVQNTILTQDKYKEAMANYLEAKHEARIVSGATRAVDHRKSMLESLVKLHGQQYFAGPNIPRDLKIEWQQKHDQRKSNSTIKIGKRRTT